MARKKISPEQLDRARAVLGFHPTTGITAGDLTSVNRRTEVLFWTGVLNHLVETGEAEIRKSGPRGGKRYHPVSTPSETYAAVERAKAATPSKASDWWSDF